MLKGAPEPLLRIVSSLMVSPPCTGIIAKMDNRNNFFQICWSHIYANRKYLVN
jgi:hypothetical protein